MPKKQPETTNKLDPFKSKATLGGGITAIRNCNPTDLHNLVMEASLAGGIVSIGVTRDMGSATLGILIDGEQHKEYAKDADELHGLIATLDEWLKSR